MIADLFARCFGRAPDVVASAPGRVNLIGEHTDYNDGFALPMAIDRRVHVALARRSDERIVVYSEEFAEQREIDLAPPPPMAGAPRWEDYVRAVLLAMPDAQRPRAGADIFISSGVPVGAGLSSSAALEIALARGWCALVNLPWDALAAARLAQHAENEFVGVRCGIMDQVASACGREGHAMLLDCRTLDLEHVRLPAAAAIVVMDTGVRRSLSASEYNDRRLACERAAVGIRHAYPDVRALRDATAAQLEAAASSLDALVYRRARHVIEENARPAQLRRALEAGDLAHAGHLMNDSHQSLRDLYDVSSTHLDLICRVAREHGACYGARLTGAGFGGCAIALVRADAVAEFIAAVQPRYEANGYKRAAFYAVLADDGARLERARVQ
ncbi:MAG: galactokinase [Gemmatimonadaceae bacterium]